MWRLSREQPSSARVTRDVGRRGQSLVELALVLPLILLLLLFGIDFGRVFLGWVELNNVVREAANFAAQNPAAWNTVNPDATAQAEYARLVNADAAGINCTLPNPLPTPSFPNGPNGPNGIGQPVAVGITCNFRLITPVIGNIVGNPLHVSSSAAFPIRNGVIAGIPVAATVPSPSPSPSPEDEPSPSPSPSPSASPSPTPMMCTVPDLVGDSTRDAPDYWGTKGHAGTAGAGFNTLNLLFNPAVSNNSNYVVGHQTLTPGTSLPCGTTAMTVSP